jgi:RNAse (barnase) inhibitor barstar
MARKEIVLEGAHWRSQADFYDAFFLAVGSPKSHARNLDALVDSVCGGQINAVDIPYTLVIRGYERMQEAARRFVDRSAAFSWSSGPRAATSTSAASKPSGG